MLKQARIVFVSMANKKCRLVVRALEYEKRNSFWRVSKDLDGDKNESKDRDKNVHLDAIGTSELSRTLDFLVITTGSGKEITKALNENASCEKLSVLTSIETNSRSYEGKAIE